MSDEKLLDRVNKLEEVVTYQQQLVGELNEIVIELRTQVDELESRYAEFADRVKSSGTSASIIEDLPEKPPHY